MFDVGIWEVALLLVIAMIVVGPDRLPKLATTLGRWTGKIRRMAQTIQRDIDRQIAIEDQAELKASVESMRKNMNDASQALNQNLMTDSTAQAKPAKTDNSPSDG